MVRKSVVDALDGLLEIIPIACCVVFHPSPIVVDGVGAITQQLGNARRRIDPQPNERKNTQLGVEGAFLVGNDLIFRAKKTVELVDKIGENGQERAVELLVEKRHLLV